MVTWQFFIVIYCHVIIIIPKEGVTEMTANTYINIQTMDILNQIDRERLSKPGKQENNVHKAQNLFYTDTYTSGFNITDKFQCITYQKEASKKDCLKINIVKGFIPWEIVDKLNEGPWYCVKGDLMGFDGFYFKKESIPPINQKNLMEVKAENNVISFGMHKYFKYVSKDGKEHYMQSGRAGFGAVLTEYMRGVVYDKQAYHYMDFWNDMMNITGPDLPGRNFEYEEVENYMEEAGIKPGFFTVKMKEESRTLFYSQNKISRMIEKKEDYDHEYDVITQKGRFFHDYEPGTVFKINGNEYTLKEDYTLDIPYGEDIFNIEYPKIPQ